MPKFKVQGGYQAPEGGKKPALPTTGSGVKPAGEELPVEILITAIVEVAAAMKKIDRSRLRREALVTLIHDSSKIGKPQIRLVLNNLAELEKLFLKPKVA